MAATAPAKWSVSSAKVYLRLYAYRKDTVDNFISILRNKLQNEREAVKFSMVRLPTRQKIFVVNRSPHIDKKSREHFGIVTHNRLVILDRYVPLPVVPAGITCKYTAFTTVTPSTWKEPSSQ